MAKIIRPNLVNTVRSSEISAMLRWGALFAVLLAGQWDCCLQSSIFRRQSVS